MNMNKLMTLFMLMDTFSTTLTCVSITGEDGRGVGGNRAVVGGARSCVCWRCQKLLSCPAAYTCPPTHLHLHAPT